MSVALLFPGQGSQTPGFLHALPDEPCIRQTLEEASQQLGLDALTLDSEVALEGSVAAQLSLLIAGSCFARFMLTNEIQPAAAAGISVGAFSAAVAAGALSFQDALRLVRRRAELMEQFFPGSTHGMAVIDGLDRRQILYLLTDGLFIANENAALQFVVSGANTALESLCSRALAAGAHRARRLHISVPSHSALLQPAAEELRSFAAEVPFANPSFPLYSNRNARPINSAMQLRKDLIENMASPVAWRDVLSALNERGIDLFLEAPPGHSLAGLVHANLVHASVYSADDMRWSALVRAAQRGR